MIRIAVVLFVFSFCFFVYPQTTLNVPAQYSTIQTALNAAQKIKIYFSK